MNRAILLANCDTLYKKISNTHLDAESNSNDEDKNDNFEQVVWKY